MKKTVLSLAGLDCPHCAEKIAIKVKKLDYVHSANMDFINKKLYINHSSEDSLVLKDAEKIVYSLEPDVKVSVFDDKEGKTEEKSHKFDIVKIAAAAVLYVASFFLNGVSEAVVLVVAYLIIGYDVLFEAVRNIIKGRAFDENFLMAVASIGAMIIGDMDEGVAVMLFYQVGELFQNIAVDRSRKSITKLMELKPEWASLKTPDGVETVPPETVEIGDVIVIKPGERIPLDCVLTTGSTTLDMSALTGESVPVEAKIGTQLLSGSINVSSVIEAEVTQKFENSTVTKLLDMVQNSSANKAKTEKFITRFARAYTPIVVIAALLLAVVPPFFTGFSSFGTWVYRALVFLVISCPCALVISVPLSFFAGIGAASKCGILIKGAKSLEALSKCETVAFDKTGTVTKGVFMLREVVPVNVTENELLAYAAAVEKNSNHPIAKSIVSAYKGDMELTVSEAEEIAGFGLKAVVNGKTVICSNAAYMRNNNIEIDDESDVLTAVYVSVDGKYEGKILLGDEIKESSAEALRKLKNCGIKKTVMLTGDKKAIAESVGKQVGIDEVKAQLLPENKVQAVEELIKQGSGTVAFAGDGINDAPVIARADVGIAMGGLGSDAAIEAADVVLMNDDLAKIAQAVRISDKTMKIAKQNIVFALGVKVTILVLGALGLANMWAAVFADVGVSFIAILNALRAMRTGEKK